MLLEIMAQIEKRSSKRTFLTEEKSDEESSDSSISIKEGVDGLELGVRQGTLNEKWQRVVM